MRPSIWFVAVAVAIVACGSFDASTDPPAADGGGLDSAGDAPAIDAGAVEASAPFCATKRGTVCEDFDDPGSGTFPSTEITDASLATFELVGDPHVSSPNALRLRMPAPADSASCRNALRYVDLDVQATNGVTIEYKIRPTKLSGSAFLGSAAVLNNVTNTESCAVYLQHTSDGAKLIVKAAGGTSREAVLSRKAPLDTWTSVVIEVMGVPGDRHATVTLDGMEAVKDARQVFQECQNGTRLTKADVGIYCATNALGGPLEVAFDDVRVTAH